MITLIEGKIQKIWAADDSAATIVKYQDGDGESVSKSCSLPTYDVQIATGRVIRQMTHLSIRSRKQGSGPGGGQDNNVDDRLIRVEFEDTKFLRNNKAFEYYRKIKNFSND